MPNNGYIAARNSILLLQRHSEFPCLHPPHPLARRTHDSQAFPFPLLTAAVCLTAPAPRAQSDRAFSLTLSPFHLAMPVFELTGEYALSPKSGIAAIGGYGSTELKYSDGTSKEHNPVPIELGKPRGQVLRLGRKFQRRNAGGEGPTLWPFSSSWPERRSMGVKISPGVAHWRWWVLGGGLTDLVTWKFWILRPFDKRKGREQPLGPTKGESRPRKPVPGKPAGW